MKKKFVIAVLLFLMFITVFSANNQVMQASFLPFSDQNVSLTQSGEVLNESDFSDAGAGTLNSIKEKLNTLVDEHWAT